MLHLSQDDIEYLRPSNEANYIQHLPNYIKSGSGSDSQRAIFYGVDLENYELEQIENLKAEISGSGISLNSSWGDRELLKYLYGANFVTQRALENLKESLRWRTEVQMLAVTDKTLEVLHSGVIYSAGRDNQSRPVLILNLDRFDSRIVDKNEASIVLTFFLDSLKQHSFFQGKIENLVLIIDAANREFRDLPFDKFDALFRKVVLSYPTIIDKVYILNASPSFKSQYNAVKGFLDSDQLDNITFLSSSELYKLQEKIPSAQLESKYGGVAPNITSYWPISAIRGQANSYGYKGVQVYEAPAQTYERYTSNGVYGNTAYFDFDSSENKRIYERSTMAIPTSDFVYARIETEQPVQSVPPAVETSIPAAPVNEEIEVVENEIRYDFNDDALLSLVAGESRFIQNSRQGSVGKSREESPYKYEQTNKSPYLNSASTTYQVDSEKKSPNPIVEEWSVKKYLKPIDENDDDAEDTKIEFCGLCVSTRRVTKH